VHTDDYKGEYDHQYYWSKLIYPPTFRILVACYPGVEWEQLFVGLTDKKLENLRKKDQENGNGNGSDHEDEDAA